MDTTKINLVIKLLNNVETKGSANLNNLLGAIQVLEGLKQELSQKLEYFDIGEPAE